MTGEHGCVGWEEEERAFQAERKAAAHGKKHLRDYKQLQNF